MNELKELLENFWYFLKQMDGKILRREKFIFQRHILKVILGQILIYHSIFFYYWLILYLSHTPKSLPIVTFLRKNDFYITCQIYSAVQNVFNTISEVLHK